MDLYWQITKLLFNKFILRKNNGIVIKEFAEKMGIVYIKLAQILATQNYGNIFTEKDRQMLSSICDNCNPISYEEVEKILKQEYGNDLSSIFSFIEKEPLGSASVSQVHRAMLNSGEEVAIKIKRKDVTINIENDIEKIRKIVHKFGRIISFGNYTGGDHALDLYLEWIKQETDFTNECQNIRTYQKFANVVNGKVKDTKLIKVPALYENYCTENIIVMEYIKTPTVNKMPLTEDNKRKIITALNSYIKSSFWAMFNDKPIAFHGDPHSGNICIDENGNICFLDMGLLFVLSEEDAKLCRKFFLLAYSGNYEELYEMLVKYGNMSEEKKQLFKEDCKKYSEQVKTKEVTFYFIDMINVCLKYEFVPPNFLFSMAKAFLCLNGISNFTENGYSAIELLQELTVEYLIKRSLKDCKELIVDGINLVPKYIENTLENGIINTVAKVCSDTKMRDNLKSSLLNFKETLELIKVTYGEESANKRTKHL